MSENNLPHVENLKKDIDKLSNSMREADQFHTLEEQAADMKRQGIDPAENYDKWDNEDKDDWNNKEWERKTPDDLK